MTLELRPRPGRWVAAVALGGLLAILVLRLIPFTFAYDGRIPFERVTWRPLSLRDVPLNVALFIPFAFGLAGTLVRRGDPWPSVRRRVLLVSVGLSAALEAVQIFMPDRAPSFADIAANALGAAAGLWLFRAWAEGFVVSINRSATRRNLVLATLLYGAVVAGLTVYLQRSVRLSDWDASYPLLVGNETNGKRPWEGTVSRLYFVDRAVSPDEAEAALAGEEPAGYDFTGAGPYLDQLGLMPPLGWNAGAAEARGSVRVGAAQWLLTAEPVSEWADATRAASAFTLGVDFEAAPPNQSGPARIVTVSADPTHRNVTLGQKQRALLVRLRTPASGTNGQKPEFALPEFFTSGGLRQVIVSYDAPVLNVYTNTTGRRSVSLAPGLAFFKDFTNANEWEVTLEGNANRYDWLYYGVMLLPVALVAAAVVLARRAGRKQSSDFAD